MKFLLSETDKGTFIPLQDGMPLSKELNLRSALKVLNDVSKGKSCELLYWHPDMTKEEPLLEFLHDIGDDLEKLLRKIFS